MWTKFAKMSVREAMISLAGKPGHGEQLRWFDKVAEAANISRRTARSLWRNEIQSDDHRAARAVRQAAQVAEARREARALADQYQAIIGGMRAQDETFYSAEIARLERLVRIIGGLNSSRD